MHSNSKKYSFTIIELSITVAIIAVLISLSLGVYTYFSSKSNILKTETLVHSINIAMQSYKQDIGYYFQEPSSNFSSNSTNFGSVNNNILWFNKGGNIDLEFIKYFDYQRFAGLKNIDQYTTNDYYFKDSWGNPMLYKYPGKYNTETFDFGSVGPDGKFGDNSNNASDFGKGDDITNFKR